MSLSRVIAVAVVLAAVNNHTATAQARPAPTTPLEGVWNYVPPRHGQAIYQANSYVMFQTVPDSAATSTPPSESDQARLYRTMSLQSGTFTIADTIVTMNQTYAKNPRQAPRSWKWSYSLKGDTLTWHVLDAQGRVTSSGLSVRAPR